MLFRRDREFSRMKKVLRRERRRTGKLMKQIDRRENRVTKLGRKITDGIIKQLRK